MAGILDSKTRVLDAIVTNIGRSQIARGGLKIEFASFTDATTYYQADEVTANDDANMRIYFEAPGTKQQDFITFETDDSGRLLGYPKTPDMTIAGDELFKTDSSPSDINSLVFVSGSGDFASLSDGVLASSINNFKNNYIIGTTGNEGIKDKRELRVKPDSHTFLISNTFPFAGNPRSAVANIDSVECLFLDKRLSHLPNFKFLPPMVKEASTEVFNLKKEKKREIGGEQIFLGSYKPLNEHQGEMTFTDVIKHLNGKKSRGIDPDEWTSSTATKLPWASSNNGGSGGRSTKKKFLPETSVTVNRERSVMTFLKTSEENNIIMQIFEVDDNRLKFKKLDVIDFGEFTVDADEDRPNKHVFFVGKVFLNSFNIPTFVNIFTIILD
jgi:hypothetical protein